MGGGKTNSTRPLMSKKQPNDIGKVLMEIAIAVTPIIFEIVRGWIQGDDRTGTSTTPKRKPRHKTA
jgi:hypothetical protein